MSSTIRRPSGRLVAAALALSLALAACGSDGDSGAATADVDTTQDAATESSDTGQEATGPLEVVDAYGRTISLDEPAQRVACLQTACDDVMAQLGLVPVVSGLSGDTPSFPMYYGDRASEVAYQITGDTDYELIASLEPDLIYVREGMDDRIQALEGVAPIVVGRLDSADPESLVGNAVMLATLLGREDDGEAIVDSWNEFIADIEEQGMEGGEDVRLAILNGFVTDTYAGWNVNNPFCEVLVQTGIGQCAIPANPSDDDAYTSELSAEAMLEIDPTHIAYYSDGERDSPGLDDRTDAVFERLTAVQEDRVYIAGGGVYCCTAHEMSHAVLEYLHHVGGDAYPDPGPLSAWEPVIVP